MLKKVLLFLGFALLVSCVTEAQAISWKKMDSDHFVVHYTTDDDFVKKVLEKAEDYYRSIAVDIGYPRYSDFWTWDKRVHIYIHPDKESYLKATDMPEWSEGMADYVKKEIVSYVWGKDFVESLLPHEMAHLIFRDFVGFTGKIPLWLDEGVAQWAEVEKRAEMKAMAKDYYDKDQLMLLSDLITLDVMLLKEIDRVYIRPAKTKTGEEGVLFLSVDQLVQTYYLVSVSLVGFLIEKYGSDRFAVFCRQLRDGKEVAEALKFSYPAYVESLEDLEERWREYLASEN